MDIFVLLVSMDFGITRVVHSCNTYAKIEVTPLPATAASLLRSVYLARLRI
jgi:hypothetical protein